MKTPNWLHKINSTLHSDIQNWTVSGILVTDLPSSAFEQGGAFDEVARAVGWESGHVAAQKCDISSLPARKALDVIEAEFCDVRIDHGGEVHGWNFPEGVTSMTPGEVVLGYLADHDERPKTITLRFSCDDFKKAISFTSKEIADLLEEDKTSYEVAVEKREGGNWSLIDGACTSHNNLDEAEEEMTEVLDCLTNADSEFGPGEYRISITDDGGNEIACEECIYDPIHDRIAAATILHQMKLEFSTLIIGIDDEGIFKTKQNGGSKGAYSRQESDGRWSETAEEIEKLSLVEAVREIGNAKQCTLNEAIDIIAEASIQDREEIIREIADDLEDKEKEEIEV